MKCPYCKEEMTKGYIYGDRYRLKWLAEDKKLFLGTFIKGGILLGNDEQTSRPKVKTYMCNECNKFIIDGNEK